MADVVMLRGLGPARRRANMSMQAVAEAMGVSRQSVFKWETGDAWPSPDRLPALAELLGVSIDELYTGEGAGSAKDPGGASPSPTNDHNMEGTA